MPDRADSTRCESLSGQPFLIEAFLIAVGGATRVFGTRTDGEVEPDVCVEDSPDRGRIPRTRHHLLHAIVIEVTGVPVEQALACVRMEQDDDLRDGIHAERAGKRPVLLDYDRLHRMVGLRNPPDGSAQHDQLTSVGGTVEIGRGLHDTSAVKLSAVGSEWEGGRRRAVERSRTKLPPRRAWPAGG